MHAFRDGNDSDRTRYRTEDQLPAQGSGIRQRAAGELLGSQLVERSDDVGLVETEQPLKLGHHPQERGVGQAVLLIATTDIGVHAGKPHLLKVSWSAIWWRPCRDP